MIPGRKETSLRLCVKSNFQNAAEGEGPQTEPDNLTGVRIQFEHTESLEALRQISERKELCRGRYLDICKIAQVSLWLDINLCIGRVKLHRAGQEQLLG